jgi:hypothetical protein
MRAPTYALLFSLLLPLSASAESMRCGKWVVNETATPDELLQKCGEPLRKERKEEAVYARNVAGGRAGRIGTQVIELWHYQRSRGSLPQVVIIVDGKIRSIERTE